MPTIEDDYSSLHPILLYAQKGIDYQKLKKDDPYNVAKINVINPETKRKIIKTLFLTAINAKDEKSCFQAVKSELQMEIPYFKFTFKNLSSILHQLKDKHSEIADDFCNGKGIRLLNLDSQIAEYIIEKFVKSTCRQSWTKVSEISQHTGRKQKVVTDFRRQPLFSCKTRRNLFF